MRTFLFVAPLLALAALVTGDDKPEERPKEAKPASNELKLTLAPKKANEEARIGYSKPRVIALETNAPRFLFEIPNFKSKEPLFFRVSLGETKGVPFYGALDKSGKTGLYDLLYLDRDRDLDLTNDGAPQEARVRTIFDTSQKLIEFLAVELNLPYARFGKEGKEPYSSVFYIVVDAKKRPLTIQVERDGWRAGTAKLADGKSYRMVMVDDDSDGQYTTSDSWALQLDTVAARDMLTPDATRSMLFPAWSSDQKWTVEVKSIDPGGREATLIVNPAKETERDYFMRIAKQRQSPQERALDIDPLRPKATKSQKVDWITGRDDKYAIQIASSPNVQKPVLLFFGHNANRQSVFMDQFTFRDREIVTLSKRFVCGRIDAVKLKGLLKRYGIDAYPIIIVMSHKGVEIGRDRAGFRKPRELAAFLKSTLR
jgi:hypothetical protein